MISSADPQQLLQGRLRDIPGLSDDLGFLEGRQPTTFQDVVEDAQRLIDSVTNLMATDTVHAVAEAANKLGFQEQVNEGVDTLVGMLGDIQEKLEALRGPVSQLGALSGTINMLRPLITGLGGVVNAPGGGLSEVGLGEVVRVTGPVEDGISLGRDFLDQAGKVLDGAVSINDLNGVQNRLSRLAGELLEYKGSPA